MATVQSVVRILGLLKQTARQEFRVSISVARVVLFTQTPKDPKPVRTLNAYGSMENLV